MLVASENADRAAAPCPRCLLAGWAMIAACAAILSPEERPRTEKTPAAATAGTAHAEGASSCARCLPATAVGLGRTVRVAGGGGRRRAAELQRAVPFEARRFLGGLTVSSEGCACTCAPPIASCAVTVLFDTTPRCATAAASLPSRLSASAFRVGPGGSMEVQSPQIDAGSCQPQQEPSIGRVGDARDRVHADQPRAVRDRRPVRTAAERERLPLARRATRIAHRSARPTTQFADLYSHRIEQRARVPPMHVRIRRRRPRATSRSTTSTRPQRAPEGTIPSSGRGAAAPRRRPRAR